MTNETKPTTTPVVIEVENNSYTDLLVLVSSSLTQPNPNLTHYKSGYFRLCGKELIISCSKRDREGQKWSAKFGERATPEEVIANSPYDYSHPICFYKNAKSFRGIYNFILERQTSEQKWERLEREWKEMRTA
jgi:hypothetical protein